MRNGVVTTRTARPQSARESLGGDGEPDKGKERVAVIPPELRNLRTPPSTKLGECLGDYASSIPGNSAKMTVLHQMRFSTVPKRES